MLKNIYEVQCVDARPESFPNYKSAMDQPPTFQFGHLPRWLCPRISGHRWMAKEADDIVITSTMELKLA